MIVDPLRIFIGYDSREPAAYHALVQSIIATTRQPVTIAPLVQSALRATGLYTRDRMPNESTEFSLTRFLVPYLVGYRGRALFLDCDMLCLADLAELWAIADTDPGRAVWVVQHDYVPKSETKFLGHVQTAYPRKNWSSVMLFNAARCGALSRDYVNTATGLALHRFHWLDDSAIGALPLEWNYLVGEAGQATVMPPKIVHFTNGGPWWDTYANDEPSLTVLWRHVATMMLDPMKMWRG